MTDRCSNVVFLKLNNFLPTGIVNSSFFIGDSFLTTYKKEMGKSET